MPKSTAARLACLMQPDISCSNPFSFTFCLMQVRCPQPSTRSGSHSSPGPVCALCFSCLSSAQTPPKVSFCNKEIFALPPRTHSHIPLQRHPAEGQDRQLQEIRAETTPEKHAGSSTQALLIQESSGFALKARSSGFHQPSNRDLNLPRIFPKHKLLQTYTEPP